MKKPFRLEYIGEAKYLAVQDIWYNDEPHELYLLNWSDEENTLLTAKDVGYTSRVYCSFPQYDKEIKSGSAREVWKRKDDWRECLLAEIEKYDDMEQVNLFEALQSAYTLVKKSKLANTEFRVMVNNDPTHLLDMNEIMVRILFPINEIKGDVSYFYIYAERYVVIREYIHNRIYVIDAHDFKCSRRLFFSLKDECKVCKLSTKSVEQGTPMYKTSIASDEPRIKIILDPDSTPELVRKAKGLT